jgi:hypothetical protein
MTEQTYSAGHVFFRAGDPGDCAYLVHDGRVELLDGEKRVTEFGPEDVFGEMSLVEERPRARTARAATDVRATPLTRDDFEKMLSTDPERSRHYLRALFERLRSLTSRSGTMPALARPTPSEPAELPVGEHGQPLPEGWSVVLLPLTRQAARTLPDNGIKVTRLPFRLGRTAGAREKESLDLNDVWLLDDMPYNVSRNHCEIDLSHEGLIVRDRGSHLGCLVNDTAIGGKAVYGYTRLGEGENVLVLGGRMSPYQFRVTVSTHPA